MIALQCCVEFCCTTIWINHNYIYGGYSPWGCKELDMTKHNTTTTYIYTYIHIYTYIYTYIHIYVCIKLPAGSDSKESACNAGGPGSIPGSGRSPGEGNGNSLSILAWRILCTKEPGRLQSVESKTVGSNWRTNISYMYIYIHLYIYIYFSVICHYEPWPV